MASGNISVSTGRLIIQSGGAVASKTFSASNSGNIDVNATQLVQVSGSSPINPFRVSNIGSYTFSDGKAGDVSISTQNLSVLNGAIVSDSTLGKGAGGNLTVNADRIQVIGMTPTFSPSTLSSFSFRSGDAGTVTLNTRTLTIQDSGVVATTTHGTSSAGSLKINASQSVVVDGSLAGAPFPSQIGSSVSFPPEGIRQAYDLYGVSTKGDAGDVTINTPTLRVSNGAFGSVTNNAVGNGGTLRVNANSLLLNNKGSLIAVTTASDKGGNMTLQIKDSLQLRNGSQISTTADVTGNGGNITIDTGTLLALENSDITANASAGLGGKVLINAKSIN